MTDAASSLEVTELSAGILAPPPVDALARPSDTVEGAPTEAVLSPDQRLVADVSYVTEMLGMLETTARAYVTHKEDGLPGKRNKAAENRMVDTLQRVYLAQHDPEAMREIIADAGEELTEECRRLLVQLQPAMGELRNHIDKQAAGWGTIRTFLKVRKAAGKAEDLDPERRLQLYPDDPALDDYLETHPPIPKVLETGAEVYKEIISVAAGAALYELGGLHHMLGGVMDKHTLAAVVAASACYYLSLLPVGIENYRLAKHTGSSLNPVATGIHKFLRHSKSMVRTLSTVAASYSLEPVKEGFWYAAAALIPDRGPGYLIGASVVNIGINIAQSVLSEAYLQKRLRRRLEDAAEISSEEQPE